MLVVILAIDPQLGLDRDRDHADPARERPDATGSSVRPRYRHVKQVESSALAVVQEVS